MGQGFGVGVHRVISRFRGVGIDRVDGNDDDKEKEGVENGPECSEIGVEDAFHVLQLVEDANDPENPEEAHCVEPSGSFAATEHIEGVREGESDDNEVEPAPPVGEEGPEPVAIQVEGEFAGVDEGEDELKQLKGFLN